MKSSVSGNFRPSIGIIFTSLVSLTNDDTQMDFRQTQEIGSFYEPLLGCNPSDSIGDTNTIFTEVSGLSPAINALRFNDVNHNAPV
jgi:hypothetical protein